MSETRTNTETEATTQRRTEQRRLSEYRTSTTDYLVEVLATSSDITHSSNLSLEGGEEIANWKLDGETPVRCPLPDGVEDRPGARAYRFSDGRRVIETAATQDGGAR